MKGKQIEISYTDFHQLLDSDTEPIQAAYADFVKRLISEGYEIIATTDFAGTRKFVRISVDENGKVIETRM